MKQDAEYFQGREPELLYIARKLTDALELERVLTEAGVDYGVEADQYQGGIVFRTNRTGAFFYVLAEAREHAVEIMLAKGFVPVK